MIDILLKLPDRGLSRADYLPNLRKSMVGDGIHLFPQPSPPPKPQPPAKFGPFVSSSVRSVRLFGSGARVSRFGFGFQFQILKLSLMLPQSCYYSTYSKFPISTPTFNVEIGIR